MTQPGGQEASRIVELTREIAGAQGLAQLIRQAWTDASPEYRQKLADQLITAAAGDWNALRAAMEAIVPEVLTKSGMKERMTEAILAALPAIEKQLIDAAIKQVEKAAREGIKGALESARDKASRTW
jgi:hypothetical protein